MPDYRQYRLSNSRLIPVKPAMPLKEIGDLFQKRENLYFQGRGFAEGTQDAMDSGTALPGSRAIFNEVNAEAKARLEQFTKAGNYEDTVLELADVYKDYTRNLQPFISEYKKHIEFQDTVAKDDKLTPWAKQYYVDLALTSHRGVQRDPTTKALIPTYQPPAVVHDVDIPAKVDKWVKDAVATKYGSHTKLRSKDGQWWIESGRTTVKLDTPEIDALVALGRSLDPEIEPYLQREQGIAAYKTARGAMQFTEAQNKEILALAERLNVPVEQAKQYYAAQSERKKIEDNMRLYAYKYYQNDSESTYKMSETAERVAQLNSVYNRPEAVGVQGTAQNMDLPSQTPEGISKKQTDLNTDLDNTNASIKDLEKQYEAAKLQGHEGQASAIGAQLDAKKKLKTALETDKKNLWSTAARLKYQILASPEISANATLIKKAEEELGPIINKVVSLGTENFSRYEIARTAFKGKDANGKDVLKFTTVDGRTLTTSLPASKVDDIAAWKRRQTTPRVDPEVASVLNPGGYKGPSNNLDPDIAAYNQVKGKTSAQPVSKYEPLELAIRSAKNKTFEARENFQRVPTIITLVDKAKGMVNDALLTNPAASVTDVNGNPVKDPQTMFKNKKLEGVGVDANITRMDGEAVFVVRATDEKGNPTYYNVAFPGGSVTRDVMQAYYRGRDPKGVELADQWAANKALGINDIDLKLLNYKAEHTISGAIPGKKGPGKTQEIPGTDFIISVEGAHSPISSQLAYEGSEPVLILNVKQGDKLVPVKQGGRPVMRRQSDANGFITDIQRIVNLHGKNN
jgi:hypothetical protein